MTPRRRLLWAGQLGLGAAVVWLAARTLRSHWEEFRGLDVQLDVRPGLILLAAAVVLVTYAALIEAWRRVLAGWAERLRFSVAARIWVLANLGRYLPGKVWAIAGLAVLAQRAGVGAWAATASAGVMQLLALGTGVAWVAATIPLDLPGLPSAVALAAAAVVTAATVAALVSPSVVGWMGRRFPKLALRPLALPSVISGAIITAAAWAAYGVAFWLLAAGLLADVALPVERAVGVFAAGYITGLLALFAPGGAGVRELVFLGLLTPSLGAGGALALTVASRVLLTATEALAALAGLLIHPNADGEVKHG